MERISEPLEITNQLKDAVQVYTPEDEQYARAPKDDVIEFVVGAGHDREHVLRIYQRLINRGELYEVNDETVGVV